MNKMVGKKLLVILLLSLVFCEGCTHKSIDIPNGTMPQRAETYDDPVFCGRGFVYRENCGPDWIVTPNVQEAEVTLSGILAPSVRYRDYIETNAGQLRYNLFYLSLQNGLLRFLGHYKYVFIRSAIVEYEIKLVEKPGDILVKNVGEAEDGSLGGGTGDEEIRLLIEIPANVQPGDYTINFIVEANGRYCDKLPCVIHVVE